MTERDLAKRFIATWHLNVPERKSLPASALAGSLLVEEICAIVEEKGWYPIDGRPEQDFDGGLIERLDGGRCKIYWKVECGVSRFALKEVNQFQTLAEGARQYATRFFGNSFDGIGMDWSR